jgi:hypothetical protein
VTYEERLTLSVPPVQLLTHPEVSRIYNMEYEICAACSASRCIWMLLLLFMRRLLLLHLSDVAGAVLFRKFFFSESGSLIHPLNTLFSTN